VNVLVLDLLVVGTNPGSGCYERIVGCDQRLAGFGKFVLVRRARARTRSACRWDKCRGRVVANGPLGAINNRSGAGA
jgi:hypothetical protein